LELLRPPTGQVDPLLAHNLDDPGMDSLGGRRASRVRGMASTRGTLEQGLAHLRSPGVVKADEENMRHQGVTLRLHRRARDALPGWADIGATARQGRSGRRIDAILFI